MVFWAKKKHKLVIPKSKIKIDAYYHVLHNHKNGNTKSFRLHKNIPYLILILVILAFTAIGVLAQYCFYLNNNIVELEKTNNANRNLKSEVEALTLKIKTIQKTMSQMENLSTKIQKASTRKDDRMQEEANFQTPSGINLTDTLGIGPLSKEDYEFSKHLTGIKQNKLKLKTLFDLVDSSENESSKKLMDFKKLILELRQYNLKLHLIPDLSPTKGRLSSTYGWRMSPFSGKERMHLGLDIAAPMGTPIYATADGTVVRVALTDDYGKMLEIQHTSKLLTRYGHTSLIYVHEGQKVKKGEMIAAVGTTGRSTGPHVHYEIEVNGKRVDPENYIVLW